MQTIAVLPRILGSLFYYSPKDEQIQTLFSQLESIPELFDWQDKSTVAELCRSIQLPDNDELIYQHSVLFEGQGEMAAPPWGSVYLDKDNLVMSDSTIDYRQFLAQNQLFFTSDIKEPEDQFGLMLLALSQLLEQGKSDAAVELLEQHLLPWGFRYLELLADSGVSDVYSKLAQITKLFLQQLQTQYQLKPVKRKIHF